ncbi:hypothetical protein Peur_066000 [Populus x canadensis]
MCNRMFMVFPLSNLELEGLQYFNSLRKIQNNSSGWATRSYYCRTLIMQLIRFSTCYGLGKG